MNTFATNLINTLGGVTVVSGKTRAPVSTVASWKTNGLSESRLDHLRLIAKRDGIRVNWETGEPADHDSADSDGAAAASCGKSALVTSSEGAAA